METTMTTDGPKFPDIHVKLSGTDSNTLMLMGKVASAMRRAGADQADITEMEEAVFSSDSPDAALRVLMGTVTVS